MDQTVQICVARYRLVQYPCHAIHKELEILRAVQSTEEVAEAILWENTVGRFRYWIHHQN